MTIRQLPHGPARVNQRKHLHHIPGEGLIIRDGPIEIGERLRDQRAHLRVVFQLLDVDVLRVVGGENNGDVAWEVKVGVQDAGAVAVLDSVGVVKVPDVVGAGPRAIEAFLDAVAHVLDFGEEQLERRHDASNIEALGVYRTIQSGDQLGEQSGAYSECTRCPRS
jgi:hypothetical protein